MRIKTGNQGFLRRQNLAGIFQHLYENAPVSRIELARLTGLNKATVTSLINDLLKNDFVREIGETVDRRAGRREVLLDINPQRGCFLSAEIGVGFVSAIATNFAAQVIWNSREAVGSLEPDFLLAKTVEILTEARRAGEERCGPLQGIAVGIPGLVDRKSGRLLFAPNLRWRNVDVLQVLHGHFPTKIFIDNEATLAALGEKFFGVARGANNVLYISAGVGIGGGLIVGGELYNGAGGFAAEFGHMTMDPDGERCGCGNVGCWETQASQAALFREIVRGAAAGPTLLTEMLGGDFRRLSVQMIVEAARQKDPVALAALEKIGTSLGTGIDSLVKAFNPELIVFGGILSVAGEFLLPAIRRQLRTRWLLESARETPVVTAQFGSDAAMMGGIAKMFQLTLSAPTV